METHVCVAVTVLYADNQVSDDCHSRTIACDQKKLEEVVKQKEYAVTVVLNIGEASASAYTCDLSYEYVKINAEYTT